MSVRCECVYGFGFGLGTDAWWFGIGIACDLRDVRQGKSGANTGSRSRGLFLIVGKHNRWYVGKLVAQIISGAPVGDNNRRQQRANTTPHSTCSRFVRASTPTINSGDDLQIWIFNLIYAPFVVVVVVSVAVAGCLSAKDRRIDDAGHFGRYLDQMENKYLSWGKIKLEFIYWFY